MAGDFNGPRIDFSPLADIGLIAGAGIQNDRLKNALAGVPMLPGGTPDYTTMGQRIMNINPDLGLKFLAAGTKAHEIAINPVTGEPYDKFAPLSAAAPSYDAGADPNMPTDPIAKRAYLQALGQAAGKLAANKPTEDQAKQTVTDSVGDMVNIYRGLKDQGALVDPEHPDTWNNVTNYLAGTGIGQMVGGALGTQSQDLRNQINQIRPILINSIRQATHQGARGLDSNVELSFYLQQATDPKYGWKANIAALDRLDRAYGMGGALTKNLTPQELAEARAYKFGPIKDTKGNVVQPTNLDAGTKAATPTFGPEYEGKTVYGPDKKPYVIKNGQPVPVGQ